MLTNSIRMDSAALSAEFAHHAAQPPAFTADPKETLQESIARGFLKPALAGLMRDHIQHAVKRNRAHALGSDRVIGENALSGAVNDALDCAAKSIPTRFIHDVICLHYSRGPQAPLPTGAEIGELIRVEHSDDTRHAIAHELDYAEQKHFIATAQADAVLPATDTNRKLRYARRIKLSHSTLLNAELAANGLTAQQAVLAGSPLTNNAIAFCAMRMANNEIESGARPSAPAQLAQRANTVLALTTDSQMRAQAHMILAKIHGVTGADRVVHWRAVLASAITPQLRSEAHAQLGVLRDGDSVDHLRQALDLSQDIEVKARMHYELAQLNDGGIINHLGYALALTDNPQLKAAVQKRLAEMTTGNGTDNRQVREPEAHKPQGLTQT